MSAIHDAAREGDVVRVKQLIEAAPSLVNDVEKGTSPASHESFSKRKPIHVAARNGQTAVAELLLSYGADPNEKCGGGWTPIHYAANFGHVETLELLLARGGDMNVKLDSGETPLALAKKKGYLAEATKKLLVQRGAQASSAGCAGIVAAMIMVATSALCLLRLLV